MLVDREEKAQVAESTCAPDEKPKRRPPMPRLAPIFQRAWRCSTKRTGAATTSCVQPLARTRGVRVPDRRLRQGRATDRGASSPRGVEGRPGRCYSLKILLHTVKAENTARRRQRAHLPAPFRHRPAATPALGTGPGRIPDGLADPERASDRGSDRPASDDRSRTAGGDASHAVCHAPSGLLYRFQPIWLAGMPHRQRQHGAWDERCLGKCLWLFRVGSRTGLSPLPRRFSFHQARLDLVEKHGLSPTGRKSTLRPEWLPFGCSRSRPPSISCGQPLAHAIEAGDLIYACYSMCQSGHGLRRARCSDRHRVARIGEEPYFARKARFDDIVDAYPEPTALYRDHEGPHCDFSTFSA